MQGNGTLNAHIPSVVVSLSGVCAGVYLGILGLQDGLIPEPTFYFKHLLIYTHWLIE